MDLRRLRAGEWIAAASGAALLLSLFLPWYEAADRAATAWESFAVLDVVLALIAAAGVALLLVTATQRVPAVPIALDALVALGGLVATVLVLVRALTLPDSATGREWALWLGLAGSLGIFVGGVLAMRDERRPAPAPRQVETIPAPGREGAT